MNHNGFKIEWNKLNAAGLKKREEEKLAKIQEGVEESLKQYNLKENDQIRIHYRIGSGKRVEEAVLPYDPKELAKYLRIYAEIDIVLPDEDTVITMWLDKDRIYTEVRNAGGKDNHVKGGHSR